MAKASKRQHSTGVTITTPSQYGSHASMVVEGKEAPDGQVWCKDDRGEYLTYLTRLDSGLADPRRFERSK